MRSFSRASARSFAALRLFVLALALCIAAAAPAEAGKEFPRVLDIREVVSPGGVKAWLVEDHTLPIIAVQFAFAGAGSALDPADRQGLSILASNTMDEGAGPYDSAAFQKALSDNAISLSFSAGRDHFTGYLKTLTKHKDLAEELLQQALSAPRFDQDAVERMRAANIARVKSSLSDPDWKAARLLNDIAFAGHPYAMNSGGTLTSLAAISTDDLHDFAKRRLAKDRLRIGVMGDITAEELAATLDKVFGALPDRADLPAIADFSVQNAGKSFLFKDDIPQTIIQIMQPGIGRRSPDYYTGAVMNFILGGGGFGARLTDEVREKRGLTYGISSYFYDLDHLQALAVSTSTRNEVAGQVMGLIHQEWQKMRDAPVSDKELADAKSYLIGSFPLSLSSTDDIAGILMDLQLDDLPIDYLDHRAERINEVGKDDIQALARRLLTPDGLTVVMVGAPEGLAVPPQIVDKLPNVD